MSQIKRLRRPTAGGYARGDETRERIVAAAVTLFGERGFAGASTRDIASAAGVNAPALQYYFENKEGVYQACAQYIVDELKARFAPAMQQANEALKNPGNTDALIEAFLAIREVALDMVFLPPAGSKAHLFVARELADEEPSAASKLFYRRLKHPLHKLNMTLLSHITDTGPSDPVTRIRLLSIRGLVMPFFHPPGACLDLLGWKDINKARGTLLKVTLLEETRTLLESWRVAPTARHSKA
jgi:AcrR family transcriptional regulator